MPGEGAEAQGGESISMTKLEKAWKSPLSGGMVGLRNQDRQETCPGDKRREQQPTLQELPVSSAAGRGRAPTLRSGRS